MILGGTSPGGVTGMLTGLENYQGFQQSHVSVMDVTYCVPSLECGTKFREFSGVSVKL